MSTPPPTETPAPLSPEGLIRALRTCRGITQHEQDCIRNAANTLVAANTRIAEVEAERDDWKDIAELRSGTIAREIARAESLERRNHDLAQDLEKAGRVVEEYWIAAYGGFTPDEADAALSKPMLNEERALYEIVRARRAGEEG